MFHHMLTCTYVIEVATIFGLTAAAVAFGFFLSRDC
jgi:hypothetical protein